MFVYLCQLISPILMISTYIYNQLSTSNHRQSQDFPQFSTAWEVTKMHPMRPIRPDAVGRGHAVLDFLDLSRTDSVSAARVIPCVEQNHNRTIAAIATSFHLIWLIFLRIAIDIYRCYRVWSCIGLYTSPYFAHLCTLRKFPAPRFMMIHTDSEMFPGELSKTQRYSRHLKVLLKILINCLICIHLHSFVLSW